MSIEVVHGDALEWILDHDPRAFAVLLTDAPYGKSAVGGCKFRKVEIMNDHDTGTRDAVLDWWDVERRPAAVFGDRNVPHYAREHFGPRGGSRGWIRPRGVLTWDKLGAAGMGDLAFPWKPDNTEEIAVYGPGWSGTRDSSVLHYCAVSGHAGKTHPHEKPVALLMAILTKAPPGRVLDTFGGTGSVAEAAHRMGRDCTIIEIDPRWWPELDARVERLQSQMRLFA